MGRLEGGGIVDTVSRHGNDFAVLPEGLHDPELLLRSNPCKDTDRLQLLAEHIEGQLFDLGPGQESGSRVDAGRRRNRHGRCRMVPGDHDHLDAGAAGFLKGLRHL